MKRKTKKKKKKKAACIHRYGFNEIAKGYDIRAKFLPEKRCPKRYETGRVLIVTGPFVVHFRSSHCSCYSEEPATRATSNPSDVPATRKLEIQCVFPPLVSCSSPFLYIYIYTTTSDIFVPSRGTRNGCGSLISNVCSPNFTDISRLGVEQRYLSGNRESFSERVSF